MAEIHAFRGIRYDVTEVGSLTDVVTPPYDRVPEDLAIAARPVEWSAREVTVRRAGEVLVAAGFCEAMTRSVVPTLFEGRHADWFAQGYEGTPPQMCYTNPGLIQQVAQDARDPPSPDPGLTRSWRASWGS